MNPLRYTDPSGHWSLNLGGLAKSVISAAFHMHHEIPGFKQLDRYIMTHKWAYQLGQIASSYYTAFCGGCGGAVYSSYYTYLATGDMNAALRAGAITFATAQAFKGAGDFGEYTGSETVSVLTHGAVGGAISQAQGGNFSQGFYSAAFAEIATINTRGVTNYYRFAISVTVGGTVSVLGGGKFANGAQTAAYGFLFNAMGHQHGINSDNKTGNTT